MGLRVSLHLNWYFHLIPTAFRGHSAFSLISFSVRSAILILWMWDICIYFHLFDSQLKICLLCTCWMFVSMVIGTLKTNLCYVHISGGGTFSSNCLDDVPFKLGPKFIPPTKVCNWNIFRFVLLYYFYYLFGSLYVTKYLSL